MSKNNVATEEYYVVLDINVLINNVAVDEYYVVLGIKEKQKGNVTCYASKS